MAKVYIINCLKIKHDSLIHLCQEPTLTTNLPATLSLNLTATHHSNHGATYSVHVGTKCSLSCSIGQQ